MKITEILNNVTHNPSIKGKLTILKENRSDILDKVFLSATKKYGVTSNQIYGKTLAVLATHSFDDYSNIIFNMLEKLEKREVTGSEAVHEVFKVLEFLDRASQQVVINILDNNLLCGLSYEVYETKVMHEKSSSFKVPLALHLEDVNGVNPIDGTWYASRKCDGVRCITFWDSATKEIKFFSRQGKEFTTLDNLKPAVMRFCDKLIGKWVLDGELCKIDEDGNEHFDQIVGECKKKNYSITDCCYQLFDMVHRHSFTGEADLDTKFSERNWILTHLETFYLAEGEAPSSKGCHCKVLKQELIKSQEDFDRWEKYVEEGNWEGFMLRKDIPYESGRTKNLLKVKKFHDAEYIVDDILVGEIASAEPGKGIEKFIGVTALTIHHKGNMVHVGSGLTKEQRKEWYANPALILNKQICVKYFQESQDKTGKYSLRFPTLKYVYGENRDI